MQNAIDKVRYPPSRQRVRSSSSDRLLVLAVSLSILLDVTPALLLVLAYGTIYLRTLPPHRRCLHLSVI